MTDWKKLPKVELHRHLDGSVRFSTIVDLAKIHKLDLGVKDEAELRRKVIVDKPMQSLEQVLDSFWTTQKVLCNYDAIKRIAFENVEDCFHEGHKLVELRFAPVFIQKNKKIAFDEIIEGVVDGITLGMEKYEIQVGLLHIMPRSLDLQKNLDSTKDILRYRASYHKNADRLVGIDLADLETEESFKEYAGSVATAAKAGMGITIHSGEDSSAEHVKRTLEVFKAQRIGHGIQIAKDPAVMKLVKEMDVALEVCPTSNWLTNIVKKIEEHPLKYLYDQGVKVTLNSDDPHLMGIDLVNEYEVATTKLGFKLPELMQMNKWALEKSFLPAEIKTDLKKKFSEFR
jgi:adenosine deaminase